MPREADPPFPASSASITRREFGRMIGAATVGAAALGPTAPAAAQATPTPSRSEQEDLCFLSAVELASRIRKRLVSSRDVMNAHLSRIDQLNRRVNAIVTVAAEGAMQHARRADESMARGQVLGPLHGLPVAHKDLVDTAGIRTTRGSPFFRDHIPAIDALLVTRLKGAGAITLGKTNTPELGAGSQTFNTIFGATRNPYSIAKTCGGSSGGAAVALATGFVPLADGSDTGGSLRNPAAFCNVVGLRPSPGRVPREGTTGALSVAGPMARTVADVALFLSVIAGPDGRDAASLPDDPKLFAGSLEGSVRGKRVAWWKGLGGIPVEPEVRRVVDAKRALFEYLGCVVEEAEPDFSGVDEAFLTLRHAGFKTRYGAMAAERPEWVKDTIRWELAEAEKRTPADMERAVARQAKMQQDARDFFQRFDFFVLPVTQVMPFDVGTPYPREVAGERMANYIDWMRSCWYITMMSNPAISVPAGFGEDGLPVGLQIVGRQQDEWGLLRFAHAFEQATRYGDRRPDLT